MSESAVKQLEGVAFEVLETFGARGYRIDSALELDSSFDNPRNRSGLRRSLVIDAVKVGCSRVGLDFVITSGGAAEIRIDTGSAIQVLRIQRAERHHSGELRVLANTSSSWADAFEEDFLIREERWVFVYVPSDIGIAELAIAPVIGITSGLPGHLILGTEIVLSGDNTVQRGFRTDDDTELPGFEEDDEQGDLDAEGL